MMSSPFSLENHTILVTGATGVGVGAGVSQAVLEAGGRLVINGRREAQLADALERYPGAIGVLGDVTSEADAERMFREASERNGGPVTGLVNNAGVGLSELFHEAGTEDFDRLYGVDVRGLWLMSRAFARQALGVVDSGAIVNISSVHSHSTMARYALYAGAKSAVEGLTRGMAVELGQHGIRCNSLGPGYVHAEQNADLIRSWTDDPEAWIADHRRNQQAIPRLIEAIDCGRAAVFLLSEASRMMTGQSIYLDGGMTSMIYPRDILDDSPETP